MSHAKYVVGDVFDVLATLEPGSVDLVMTSPPFLALRSYLPADHEHKAKEIGSEATPGEYLDVLLDVVEACARVLAPHGSICIELGDTYAGNGGGEGDAIRGGRTHMLGTGNNAMRRAAGWPLDKSKVLVPQLFAIALAYGFNPLTGRQTEPWRVRNTVAWCRPNPPVGRDGDKFRPATSFLTIATKTRDRYWDGDAVRTAPGDTVGGSTGAHGHDARETRTERVLPNTGSNPAGAPLLDWWNIPTEPYQGSHYATFPRALVVPIVKSMCPAKVCRVCGMPSRRIVETDRGALTDDGGKSRIGSRPNGGPWANRVETERTTLGWSDCGHAGFRNGMVLDPFAGSGTTLQVATGHGRDAIGIDLDARNAELAAERIGGLFLTVEHFAVLGAKT